MAIKMAKEEYPELYDIAEKIANCTCFQIITFAKEVNSKMPYKTQCVLEMLIQILQERV